MGNNIENNIEKEVATLKKKINTAIENDEFDQVDFLSNRLCELQGLDTNVTMPRDFIFRLKLRERKLEKMKFNKKIIKVATAILALVVTSGTTYAAVKHFNNVQQMEYGLTTSNTNMNVGISENSNWENNMLSEDEVSTEILSTEEAGADVQWITKEVRKVNDQYYESDDRINWNEVEYVVDVTEFTYKDYKTACQDTNMPDIFDKVYTPNGNVLYTEYIHEEDASTNTNSAKLVSNFKYSDGEFTLDYSKILNWDGIEPVVSVITSTTPTTGAREYVSDNGDVFKLSDDEETGTKRTTVLVSYDEYTAIFSFTNLSDNEIHEILNSIIIEK